jgi:hypothetical protein
MEFNSRFETGLMSIKNNDIYLFPIIKEEIINGSSEITTLFKKIKDTFKFFNNILGLSDKEVVDILVSIMLNSNVFDSILQSIPQDNAIFKQNYRERILKINKDLEKLKTKIMINKKDIITKKRMKLVKKKQSLTNEMNIKKNKEFMVSISKGILADIDETSRYKDVMVAYTQLSYEGYYIFNEFKKLGVCYNYETKVKLQDDYISVPLIMIYDSYNISNSLEGRFLSSLNDDDYFDIYKSINDRINLKEYEEVNNLLNAKYAGPSNYQVIFKDLIYNVIILRDFLNKYDSLKKFKKVGPIDFSLADLTFKLIKKLLKLFYNIIETTSEIKYSSKHLNIVLSESKKKLLELNKIFNDNKDLIWENSKRKYRLGLYPESLLDIFYNLEFKLDGNDLKKLKADFYRQTNRVTFSEQDYRKVRGIRNQRTSNKIFEKILEYFKNKHFIKDGKLHMKTFSGQIINVSKDSPFSKGKKESDIYKKLGINPIYYEELATVNKFEDIKKDINVIPDLITIDDKGRKSFNVIPDLLLKRDYLLDKHLNVAELDDIPILILVKYLTTFNAFNLYNLKDLSFDNWVNGLDPSFTGDKYIEENLREHFSPIISYVKDVVQIMQGRSEDTINFNEILEQREQNESILSVFQANNMIKEHLEKSMIFKDIDVYLVDRINSKLIEVGFPELLEKLEVEFKNQIRKCLYNNTTTLIPLHIYYKDSNSGHTNMLSIHNNFVELAEPQGINMALSKRYEQIYNYLITFIDKSKIKRIDTRLITQGLKTSNLQPQMYEPLCDAYANFFGVLRVLYPKLPFHEVYSMTFSTFPSNIDDFTEKLEDINVSKYEGQTIQLINASGNFTDIGRVIKEKENVLLKDDDRIVKKSEEGRIWRLKPGSKPKLEKIKKSNILKLKLPSESNFYDRHYIMFDNLQQDRIIRRLQNFILLNKKINDDVKKGISLEKIIVI